MRILGAIVEPTTGLLANLRPWNWSSRGRPRRRPRSGRRRPSHEPGGERKSMSAASPRAPRRGFSVPPKDDDASDGDVRLGAARKSEAMQADAWRKAMMDSCYGNHMEREEQKRGWVTQHILCYKPRQVFETLESVREHHAGLHSFRNMRRRRGAGRRGPCG
jgi:hypothetical protein